jgi:protein-S-isoprenylcysteine O-methyltransferase Ste14
MSDGILKAAYFTGFAAACVIRRLYVRGRRWDFAAAARRSPLDMLLVLPPGLAMSVIPLIYVLTSWLGFADYRLPAGAGCVGAAVFAAALWLLWRSHADLGTNWSPWPGVAPGQRLVTSGVYRHVRHPMYGAHLMWGIAQPLLLQNWVAGLAMLATTLPLVLVRTPNEEQALTECFGDEYRSYVSRTGRFVPRFRR